MSDVIKKVDFEDKCPRINVQELHAHINGSISESTIDKLVEKKRKRDPDWGRDAAWKTNINKGDQRTLEDVFQMFQVIHELGADEDAAYMITKDVIAEFDAENVKYLELRTTPRDVGHMTKRNYVESVLRAIQDSQSGGSSDVDIRLLLSIDRAATLEDAWETLRIAEEVSSRENSPLCGLDMSGNPTKGDARIFLPVFEAARKKGLKLTLHVAESPGFNEETSALLSLPPDRLGHCTYLHPEVGGDQCLVNLLEKHQTPIEFCLTSNVMSQTVASYDRHHIRYWHQKGHPFVLCTDDKGVFATSLSEEYLAAADVLKLSPEQLWDLSFSSIDHIFADDALKQTLKLKFDSAKSSTFAHLNA